MKSYSNREMLALFHSKTFMYRFQIPSYQLWSSYEQLQLKSEHTAIKESHGFYRITVHFVFQYMPDTFTRELASRYQSPHKQKCCVFCFSLKFNFKPAKPEISNNITVPLSAFITWKACLESICRIFGWQGFVLMVLLAALTFQQLSPSKVCTNVVTGS